MLLHTLSAHALSLFALVGLGTSVVPAPAAGSGAGEGGAGEPPKPPSFADVGKAFLETLTPEQRQQEFTDLDDDEDDRDVAPEGAVPDAIAREDGATWNVEAGRWQDPTGHFVAGDPPEGAVAKPGRAAAPAAEAATEDEDARPWTKIALPGLTDRGEQELQIEIDDPAIVERINRLKSEAGRARVLQQKAREVDAQAAELAELDQYLDQDPVGFVVGRMQPQLQIAVARALLLEHFDALTDDIAAFQADPAQRHESRVALRDSMTDANSKMAAGRAMREHAQSCIRAAEALIPADADDETMQSFLADARGDLARLAQAGQRVTPDTVPQLLARRASLYGFNRSTSGTGTAAPGAAPVVPAARASTAPAAAATSGTPAARPVTDRARDVAARQPTKDDASRAQARIRQVQTQRTAAARVAPAGAGAAPVQTPVLPPEAKTDVKSASKYLRQTFLPETWAPATP